MKRFAIAQQHCTQKKVKRETPKMSLSVTEFDALIMYGVWFVYGFRTRDNGM